VVVGTTGCGDGKGAKNSVSGKVTLNGENVGGTVTFVTVDTKKEFVSPIKQDGTYQIDNPPPGQVKVVVKGMGMGATVKPPPAGKDVAKMPEMPGSAQGKEPPAKYASEKTTPLTYEVKTGKQTYDIPLTP